MYNRKSGNMTLQVLLATLLALCILKTVKVESEKWKVLIPDTLLLPCLVLSDKLVESPIGRRLTDAHCSLTALVWLIGDWVSAIMRAIAKSRWNSLPRPHPCVGFFDGSGLATFSTWHFVANDLWIATIENKGGSSQNHQSTALTWPYYWILLFLGSMHGVSKVIATVY
jgi:hypothetical protein